MWHLVIEYCVGSNKDIYDDDVVKCMIVGGAGSSGTVKLQNPDVIIDGKVVRTSRHTLAFEQRHGSF